jgi:hypothetical protein
MMAANESSQTTKLYMGRQKEVIDRIAFGVVKELKAFVAPLL